MGKVTVRYWPAGAENGGTGHIAIQTYAGGKYGNGYYISYYPATVKSDGGKIVIEKKFSGSHDGIFMPRTFDDKDVQSRKTVIEITFTEFNDAAINYAFEQMVKLPSHEEYERMKVRHEPLIPKINLKWDLLGVNLLSDHEETHNCSSMALSLLRIGGIGRYIGFNEVEAMIATLIADSAYAKRLVLYLNIMAEYPEIMHGYINGMRYTDVEYAKLRGQVIGSLTGYAAGGAIGGIGGGLGGYAVAKTGLFGCSLARWAYSLWSAASATSAGSGGISTVLLAGPPGIGVAGFIIPALAAGYVAKQGYDYLSGAGQQVGEKIGGALGQPIGMHINGIEAAIPLTNKAAQNMENGSMILSPPVVARIAMLAEFIESTIVNRPITTYPSVQNTFQPKGP